MDLRRDISRGFDLAYINGKRPRSLRRAGIAGPVSSIRAIARIVLVPNDALFMQCVAGGDIVRGSVKIGKEPRAQIVR